MRPTLSTARPDPDSLPGLPGRVAITGVGGNLGRVLTRLLHGETAITGIDQECYEAAMLDGANVFQRVRYITLPLIRPTIIVLVLLGVGRIMRGEFDMFYQLIGNNGTLIDNTDIVDTLVFRSLVGSQDFGMSSAAGLYQSVLCFVIIVIVNYSVRRYDPNHALF